MGLYYKLAGGATRLTAETDEAETVAEAAAAAAAVAAPPATIDLCAVCSGGGHGLPDDDIRLGMRALCRGKCLEDWTIGGGIGGGSSVDGSDESAGPVGCREDASGGCCWDDAVPDCCCCGDDDDDDDVDDAEAPAANGWDAAAAAAARCSTTGGSDTGLSV